MIGKLWIKWIENKDMNPDLFISEESSSGSAVAVLVADFTLEHVFDRYIYLYIHSVYCMCILYIHSNLTLFLHIF